LKAFTKASALSTLLIDGRERGLLVGAVDLVHLKVLGHASELDADGGIGIDRLLTERKDLLV